MRTKKQALAGALIASALSLGGCGAASNVLNPFYEPPPPVALLGQPNDHALNSQKEKVEAARDAFDAKEIYQRAHAPQPVNPVMQPAVVRLMWVPDHVNRHGDLVPAHYYYLKVKSDGWAVTDAFELEAQLSGGSGASGNDVSNVPYIYDKR